LSSNPFTQKYITNIEKLNPTHGLCLLNFLFQKKYLPKIVIGERPFSSMNVELFIQKLVLLLNMHLRIPHNFDDAFEIGKLSMHNNDNPFKTKRLLV
jgi:hypothetical protein